MRTPGSFLIELSSRTVDGIQKNIVKRDERNVISRRYHAKDDKEAIDAWNLDLNRIRRVFDVRPVTPLRPPLTARFQTELRIDIRATDSGARQDAENEHTVTSNVHRDVTNAETTVSGVCHDVSSTQPEGADYRNRAVRTTRTLSPSKYLPLLRLTLGQRSRLQLNPVSNVCIQRIRGVATSATGKYAWNHLQCPS